MATDMYAVGDTLEAMDSQLMLFDPLATNTSVLGVQYVDFRPLNPIRQNEAIDFTINNNSTRYIDMKNIKLHLTLKILKSDFSPIVDAEDAVLMSETGDFVAPINNILHSAFSNIECQIQQKTITTSSNYMYPYKAYLKTLLRNGRGPKTSRLQAQGYYDDVRMTSDHRDTDFWSTKDVNNLKNFGMYQRYDLMRRSRSYDLEGVILEDCFESLRRYLMPNLELKIRLTPSKSSFVLVTPSTTENYILNIEDVYLRIPHIHVNPGIVASHDAMLRSKNARYFYENNDMKVFNLNAGSRTFTLDNIYNGSTPSSVLVGFVDGESFAGGYQLNPLRFRHYKCGYITCLVNNINQPGTAYRPRFDDSKGSIYAREFLKLSDGLAPGMDNYISYETFQEGYTLFLFHLMNIQNSDEDDAIPVQKTGNLRIEGTFDEPLEKNITVLVMGTFMNSFQYSYSR